MIPAYRMEEHHEAFYYWCLAIEKGYLEQENNTLFHIDHHDDLEYGGYFHDFSRKMESLEEYREFTYNELGIADFIVPAIYEGIFSVMYNMKKVRPVPFIKKEKMVHRKGNNCLTMGDYLPFVHGKPRREKAEEYRFFTYYEGSLSDPEEMTGTVLDIDLDYFCWDDSLTKVGDKKMEITRKAYEEFQSNPYHPFRIMPRKLLRIREENGRFYVCYTEPPIVQKETDEECIRKRVERFGQWLKHQEWKPKLITICRSAHSGYLPPDYAELVEGLVCAVLEEIYEIKWIEQ